MNLIRLFILVIFILLVFLITACSTAVPLTQRFPDAPAMLKEKCPELKIIVGEKVTIVDFTKTVVRITQPIINVQVARMLGLIGIINKRKYGMKHNEQFNTNIRSTKTNGSKSIY